jgi:hypothetical protein
MTSKFFLIVSADGKARVVTGKLRPRLKAHEFAFPIRVTIPDVWGSVLAKSLDVTIPEPSPQPTAVLE